MIVVDAQTVSLFPYSSNQCSILQTLSDKKMEQCVTAHFWCKDDMIISESKVSFEDSIKKCKGLIQSSSGSHVVLQHVPFDQAFGISIKRTFREKWFNGNTTDKKR